MKILVFLCSFPFRVTFYPNTDKYNLVSKTIRDKTFDESQALSNDEELVVRGIYQMFKESKSKESERGAKLIISDDTKIMTAILGFAGCQNQH
jgi:hypothetical protein